MTFCFYICHFSEISLKPLVNHSMVRASSSFSNGFLYEERIHRHYLSHHVGIYVLFRL